MPSAAANPPSVTVRPPTLKAPWGSGGPGGAAGVVAATAVGGGFAMTLRGACRGSGGLGLRRDGLRLRCLCLVLCGTDGSIARRQIRLHLIELGLQCPDLLLDRLDLSIALRCSRLGGEKSAHCGGAQQSIVQSSNIIHQSLGPRDVRRYGRGKLGQAPNRVGVATMTIP